MTSRLDLDARLYEAPVKPRPGQTGRPRKRGQRLPTPRQMLKKRGHRSSLKLYGRHDRIRYVEGHGRCHHAPRRKLRIVVVEPLTGHRPIQAFFSTAHKETADDVLQHYANRWSIEETFWGSKSLIGMHQPQVWRQRSVERVGPAGFLLYSLVVLWFATVGAATWTSTPTSWSKPRKAPSFAAMLATLKRQILTHNLSQTSPEQPQIQKVQESLVNIIAGVT